MKIPIELLFYEHFAICYQIYIIKSISKKLKAKWFLNEHTDSKNYYRVTMLSISNPTVIVINISSLKSLRQF